MDRSIVLPKSCWNEEEPFVRACQAWVLCLCLDEIFLHREPILMAVEPISMAWVAGQRGPDRMGESWAEVIKKWPYLQHIVVDGGKGLKRGRRLP